MDSRRIRTIVLNPRVANYTHYEPFNLDQRSTLPDLTRYGVAYDLP